MYASFLTHGLAAVAILATLLVLGCWFDCRSHRIPNGLVLTGLVTGFGCALFLGSGSGYFSPHHAGSLGIAASLGGMLTGLGIFLPLYLVRGMGAGDVKLMAMVGAFLGPLATLEAALMTLVAGGLLAAFAAVWSRTVRQAAVNVWSMMAGAVASGLGVGDGCLAAPRQSAGKLPYALAIAGGTLAHALLTRAGYTLIS